LVGTERVFGKGAKILMAMEEGLVIKSTGSWYEVLKINKEIIQCRIKGNIRLKGIKNTNPVTVGDSVDIEQSLNG
jgi:ribosome biogenesis GTPase